MSNRYQAGIIRPGYDALKVPNAPTIGTATAGSSLCASVTFTAPSCVGGGAITSYKVYSSCGAFLNTGATSPIVVSGLTAGSSYTFKAEATNIYGPGASSIASNSITAIVQGQQAYTTAGTYSWVAPTGVTSVSVVTVGAGGGVTGNCGTGGAGGGALAYVNNLTVIPGNTYAVVVGAATGGTAGGASSFNTTSVAAGGGGRGAISVSGAGGVVIYGTGFSGGDGGGLYGGGGGAAGYAGAGGAGGTGTYSSFTAQPGTAGTGGGGGGGGGGVTGGGCIARGGGGGGGVGILGQGCSGAGGATAPTTRFGYGGSGGTNGGNGYSVSTPSSTGTGGVYGGGGGASYYGGSPATGVGAVRIIWPGTTRTFPSTNTGDL